MFNSPINLNSNLNTNLNVDADIAEIIEVKAKNYGYNIPIYIGDDCIRIIYLNDNNEKIINEKVEKCKCTNCPYVEKNKDNQIIKMGKNKILGCDCRKELKKYYNYFQNSEKWKTYILLQIDCKFCRQWYQNPNYKKIKKDNEIPEIISKMFIGTDPYRD